MLRRSASFVAVCAVATAVAALAANACRSRSSSSENAPSPPTRSNALRIPIARLWKIIGVTSAVRAPSVRRANESSGSSVSRCDRPLRNADPRDRAVDGEPLAMELVHALPRAGGEHELVAFEQRELDDARLDQRARALRDELQHPVEVRDAAERARDLRRRLETAVRALELVPALADVAVQPGVVDRDRRPVGEDDGRVLVVLGELADRLLGQVEVAPHLAADGDRHAEEACASADATAGIRTTRGARRRRPAAAASGP